MKILNCSIIRKGLHDSESIAITFDDGPHPKYTPMILNILEKKGGSGTFFATGNNISKNRKLTREIAEKGYLLGNHTYSHLNALFTSRGKLHDEILRTKELIEDITGKPNHYFRPPYGVITPSLLSICRRLEMSVVLWNLNTKDFRREPHERIIKRVSMGIKAGAIILFHECHFRDDARDYSESIKAVKIVLDEIILKNLKPVTVDEMLEN